MSGRTDDTPEADYERGLPPRQPRRTYTVHRALAPPDLDGRGAAAVWDRAPWSEEFVDIRGHDHPAPRHPSRFRALWDDACLYVHVAMEEPHLWATLTERDSVIFHDNDIELFLNPSNDGLAYYELEVNALDTVWDLALRVPYRMGGRDDSVWRIAGLRTAVHLEGTLNDPTDIDQGWSVELAVPHRALDVHTDAPRPPLAGERWLANLSRVQWDLEVVDGAYRKVEGRPEHNWVWSPQGLVDMHVPLRWGWFEFAG